MNEIRELGRGEYGNVYSDGKIIYRKANKYCTIYVNKKIIYII